MTDPVPPRPALHRRAAPLVLCLGLGLAISTAAALAEDWAVGGMDVVELLRGETVPGRPDIATRWHGKLWLFEAERNRNVFEADPRSYAPALDGLCPVALSEGRRSKGRPDLAVIVDGRLYLPENAAARALMVDQGEAVVAQARKVVNAARAKSRAAASQAPGLRRAPATASRHHSDRNETAGAATEPPDEPDPPEPEEPEGHDPHQDHEHPGAPDGAEP